MRALRGPTSRWTAVVGRALLSGAPALEGVGGSLTRSVPSHRSPGGSELGAWRSPSPSPLCWCWGPHAPGGPGPRKPGPVHGSRWGLGVGHVPVPASQRPPGPAGGLGGLGDTAEWGLAAQGLCPGRHPLAGESPGVPPRELTWCLWAPQAGVQSGDVGSGQEAGVGRMGLLTALLSWLRPWVQATPAPALLGTRRRAGVRPGRGSRWSQRARPCPWAGYPPPDNLLPWLEPLPAAAACQWPEAPIRGQGLAVPQPPAESLQRPG